MKKIMKKVLTLVLAFALVIAPTTAIAAVGDGVPCPPWTNCIWSGDTVSVEAGETKYFEISTEGAVGTFDFVVEGSGAFDVAICTEGSSSDLPYAEGTPVSAVDGKVTTLLTSYESTFGYGAFSITNNSGAAADYVCKLVFPEGSQGNPKTFSAVVGTAMSVTVPAGEQFYVALNMPEMEKEYVLTITGASQFGYTQGYGMPAWDNGGVYETTVAQYYMPVSFAIINSTEAAQTYSLVIAEKTYVVGDAQMPDTLELGTTDKYLEGKEYWYTWTAPEAGVFTLEMNNSLCADGWTYNLELGYNVYNFSTGWGESDKNVCAVDVVAGEEVIFGVSIPTYMPEYDMYDVYTYATGSVIFTTSFEAGASTGNGGSGEEGGEEGGSGYAYGEEINENYFFMYQELVVGLNEIMPEDGYATTLYFFRADEAGTYVFTLNDTDGRLGNYGSNEWFPFDDESEKTYTYTLNYTEAGAPVLIGVSNVAMGTITVEKVGDATEEGGILWVDYENTVTPEQFDANLGEKDEIVYFSETDEITDIVLGEDGYYHVNTADGPIVLVQLTAGLNPAPYAIDLAQAASYTALGVVTNFDENGNAIGGIKFGNAVLEYVACVDAETGMYPLTDDLAAVYLLYGFAQGWYDKDTQTGFYLFGDEEVDPEVAWMFACAYIDAEEIADDNTDAGTDEEIKNTGDVTATFVTMILFLGTALVVTGFATKRKFV